MAGKNKARKNESPEEKGEIKLPATILEKTARGISLIIDDRLYKCDRENPEATDNFFEIEGSKLPLVELEKLVKLEALDEEYNSDETSNWVRDYFQKQNQEGIIIKTKEINDDMEETRLQEFIVENIVPYFVSSELIRGMVTDEKSMAFKPKAEPAKSKAAEKSSKSSGTIRDFDNLTEYLMKKISLQNQHLLKKQIMDKFQKTEQELIEEEQKKLEKRLEEVDDSEEAELESLLQKNKKSSAKSWTYTIINKENKRTGIKGQSLFEEKFETNPPLVILDSLVCRTSTKKKLVNPIGYTSHPINGVSLVFNGDTYHLYPVDSLKELLKAYEKKKQDALIEENWEEQPAIKEMKEKKEKYQKIIDILQKKSFDITCQRMNTKSYLLKLRVPQYINIGDNGDYFLFPEVQVGVQVTMAGENFSIGNPVLCGNQQHMFTRGWDGPHGKICMGEYNYGQPSLSRGKAAAKMLSDARTVIMSGYKVGGVGPHHYLARRNFDKFWISNEQARKLVKKGQARVTNSLSKQKNLET